MLKEHDFRGSNLKKLIEQHHEITSIRFGVGEKLEDGQEWIPTDSELEQLNQMRSLTSLDLTGCKEITRRGLTHFCMTPGKIKTLVLDDCPRITNNFFFFVVNFNNLEKLSLRGCFRISDNGIEALSSLKQMRHLDLSLCATQSSTSSDAITECPTITDVALKTISRMTQLETLQMEKCKKITDQGILLLVTLRNMTFLNLSETKLTNRGLQILKQFPQLTSLSIGGCDISESEILHQLHNQAQLKRLNVSNTGVTDTFIHALSKNYDLTHLNISGCQKLTDRCSHHLNKLTTMRRLNANACPGKTQNQKLFVQSICCLGLTPKLLKGLGGLTDLRSLHISGITVLDSDDLLPFMDLHQLEMGARSAEDDTLSRLSVLKHLTDLTLHLPDGKRGEPSRVCIKALGIKVQLLRHPH